MPIKSRLQLSIMMFLEYFTQGAWYVTMGTFLSQSLQCSDIQISSAYGFSALAYIISPFFTGLIADRFFDSEKILGILHLLGAILLYFMSQSTDFDTFFWLLVVYMLLYAPTNALSSSVAMQQVKNPEKTFPSIRVLGTLGWIAANLLINFLGLPEASAEPFYLAMISALVLGVFAFTLPKTPPKGKVENVNLQSLLGLDALRMLADRSFAILLLAVFLIYIPITFYFQFGNLFLNEIGMENSTSVQTLGQVSEIGFMLLVPFFMARLGLKYMILAGMGAWVLRYVLFAYANIDVNLWMIYSGVALHGVCYDFLFVSTQVFLDKKAPKELRNSVQALVTTMTYGLGMFIGAYVAGFVGDSYKKTEIVPVVIRTQETKQSVEKQYITLDSNSISENMANDLPLVSSQEFAEILATKTAKYQNKQLQLSVDSIQFFAEKGQIQRLERKIHDWQPIWLFPAASVLGIILLFAVLFRYKESES